MMPKPFSLYYYAGLTLPQMKWYQMIIVCEAQLSGEVGNFILSQTANTVLVYYRDANFLLSLSSNS
jgi:hypothetical protein